MSSVTKLPLTGHPTTPPRTDRTCHQDTSARPFIDDPWALYRQLHASPGPVWWSGYGFWCLKEHAAVNAALRDRRLARLPPPADACSATLPDTPPATPPTWPPHLSRFAASERHSLLALEGRAHTRLRKFVTRAFMSRQVMRLEPGIRRLAHQRLDALVAGAGADRRADLLAGYAVPIPVTVIARLLGVPDEEIDALRHWSTAMVKVYTLTQTRAEEDEAERAAGEFIDRIERLIAERRLAPRDDLVSHLLALRAKPDPLLDAEIVSTAILLLNAGHEATVHQLGNAVLTLLEPDRPSPAELFDTSERTAASVQELTRFRAPLHLFIRYAQEPLTLPGGIDIGAGERVGLLLGAANRDPARFAEPDRFDPTRKDGGSLAFGAGAHYCLGVQLARLELGCALQVLFERMPQLRLSGTPRFADTFHFHGLERLDVSW